MLEPFRILFGLNPLNRLKVGGSFNFLKHPNPHDGVSRKNNYTNPKMLLFAQIENKFVSLEEASSLELKFLFLGFK